MNEIRGQKVVFGKDDYHPLDAMPSTVKKDAMVLAVPRRRNFMRRLAKVVALLVFVAVASIGGLFLALENGYLDRTLRAQAETSLSGMLGTEFEPKVGAIRLRFSENWMLAFQAGGLSITHRPSGITMLKADSIKAVLDPIALLAGKIEIARTEIGAAEGDLRFLPARPAIDWSKARIDSLPAQLATVYPALDSAMAVLARTNTREIVAGRIALLLPAPTEMGDRVELLDVDFSSPEKNSYQLTTTIAYGKLAPKLTLGLTGDGTRATAFSASLDDLAAEPLMLKYSKVTGERRYGLDLPLQLAISSERDRSLVARVVAGKGLFYADGDAVDVHAGRAVLSYDFRANKIELSDGLMDLGATVVPLEGALVDLDRVAKDKPPGFAFEVVGNDAVASAEAAKEEPEHFNATTSGYFIPETRELRLDTIGIVTASGNFAGSLDVHFVKPSPAVNFAARADTLSVATVKQLWPFWFGKKARNWVLSHIAQGTVRNGVIDVSLAAGRIPEYPEPLIYQDGEMHISFDAEDTNVKFLPDMPASSKTWGHFEQQGRSVRIDIKQGTVPLPSGKQLEGHDGVFSMPDIAQKPLMASIDISASGDAAAAIEFSSFKPINALSRLPFKAGDVTGTVKATVTAEFGLERSQNPPKPVWNVDLDLANVTIKPAIQGRKISDFDGTVAIDTQAAVIKGKADIDGMDFDVGLTEPFVRTEEAPRQWQIEGEMSEREILKLAPSLAGYIGGKVGIDIESAGDTLQKARLSLTNAEVSIPIFGWRKGAGIAATAEFNIDKQDNQTQISDLEFTGDGFGAKGDMTLDSKGVVSAKFSKVMLSTSDDFALSLQRKSSGLAINVTGNAIDMRPFLGQVKSGSSGGEEKTRASHTITAKVDRAIGYNKETLSTIDLGMSISKGDIARLNFSAVTRSGEAVVISRDGAAGALVITSGDAGAAARFADVYRNMNGGLLNVTLKSRGQDAWSGSVDIRNFALVNEARLKSIVSAKTGQDGKSLSEAVKADIDVSSQKFRRGFARLIIDGKRVRIENGVVRGDEVGATFQGIARDINGAMDMTGTFMPAYGLNRLFSELPLIGSILGNGRDRGLVGITFKLVGPYDQPKLSVNPLSLIAPGVFRNIFEFE